jgi:hypothetical protein
MSELETAGWVEVVKREADGPSRWSVNERIHVRFAARAVRERTERGEKHARVLAAGRERKRLFSLADEATDNLSELASVFD